MVGGVVVGLGVALYSLPEAGGVADLWMVFGPLSVRDFRFVAEGQNEPKSGQIGLDKN